MSSKAIRWMVVGGLSVLALMAVAIWGSEEAMGWFKDAIIVILSALGLGSLGKSAAAPGRGEARKPGDQTWIVLGFTLMTLPLFVTLLLPVGCGAQRCPDADVLAVTLKRTAGKSMLEGRCTPTDHPDGEARVTLVGREGHTLRVVCPPGEMVVGKVEREVMCSGRQRCTVEQVICGPRPPVEAE